MQIDAEHLGAREQRGFRAARRASADAYSAYIANSSRTATKRAHPFLRLATLPALGSGRRSPCVPARPPDAA